MAQKLELIKLESTKGAPNSKYPVMIYRDVLPLPDDQDSLLAMLDGNGYSTYGFFDLLPRSTFTQTPMKSTPSSLDP